MRDRKGNWQDLLASHSLAVDTKKLWLGLVATLATIALLTILGAVYTALGSPGLVGQFNMGGDSFIARIIAGDGMGAFKELIPLFNPFAGGITHFALSILLYISLMAVWSYCGGAISRLTALQYGRDDIPTLSDGLDMVRDKRNAFLFAPLTPLFGIIIFAVCNMIIGLIGNIPVIGGWITAVSIPFVALPAAIITTFIVVLGVMTFGLMFPAVSIGGKDAFEGWSSAYSYLLWGFNHFVGYTVVAAIVGALTTLIAIGLAELFIALLAKTVSIGLIGGSIMTMPQGLCGTLFPIAEGTLGLRVASWITVLIALVARGFVLAYVFSFFFTANTIICFLLRKHVDRIEIDEVYEESAEEESFEDEFPDSAMEEETEDEIEESADQEAETEGEDADESVDAGSEDVEEEEASDPEAVEEEDGAKSDLDEEDEARE